MRETLRVKRMGDHDLPMPSHATSGAAGMDLRVCFRLPRIVVKPGDCYLAGCGFAFEIPEGYVGIVKSRSSLPRTGIPLHVLDGVIDSDYRGEVMIKLWNPSNEPIIVETGVRVAQMLILPVMQARFVEVEELSETTRGGRGFGHTGDR